MNSLRTIVITMGALIAIQSRNTIQMTQVELFTPSDSTPLMVLCNVVVKHVGSSLRREGVALTPDDVNIVMDAKTNDSYEYDRAIMNLGNITNAGGATEGEDEMIIIEWDAVLIDNPEIIDGAFYWVSAGAEFDGGTEVWIGQSSFRLYTTMPKVNKLPTFNLIGPSIVPAGATSIFRLDLYIPFPSRHIFVDGFVPTNDREVISVCSALVTDTGAHFSCLPKDHLDFTMLANDRVRLDLGPVTNAGWNEDDDDDAIRITVEFAFYVSSSAIIGRSYSVGAAVLVDESATEIWSETHDITVVESEVVPADGLSTTPAFSVETITGNNVTIVQDVVFQLNITVPIREEGTFNFEVLAPFSESAAQMSIWSVHVASQGVNVPCITDENPEYTSRNNSNVYDRATWNLGRVRNTGHRDNKLQPEADVLTLHIYMIVLQHPLNMVGAEMAVTMGLNFDKHRLWIGQQTLTIVNATM